MKVEQLPVIQVIQPGTEVVLWGGIGAVVDSLMIETAGRVSYNVAYWSGETLNKVWVAEEMIKTDGARIAIGFAAKG